MNIELLDDDVRECILCNLGLENDEDYEKGAEQINQMTPREAFDRYLTWQGIIGFTDSIIEAWKSINEANQ